MASSGMCLNSKWAELEMLAEYLDESNKQAIKNTRHQRRVKLGMYL